MIIDKNYPGIAFDGDISYVLIGGIKTEEDLTIDLDGCSFVIVGSVECKSFTSVLYHEPYYIMGNLIVNGDVKCSNLHVTEDIKIRGSFFARGSVFCGGNMDVTKDIHAKKNVTVAGAITSWGDFMCHYSVNVRSYIAAKNIFVNGGLYAQIINAKYGLSADSINVKFSICCGTTLSCNDTVSAGSAIIAKEIYVEKEIHAGTVVSEHNQIRCEKIECPHVFSPVSNPTEYDYRHCIQEDSE